LCTWSQVGVILLTILDVYIYTDISLQVLLYVNKVGPYFNPHEFAIPMKCTNIIQYLCVE